MEKHPLHIKMPDLQKSPEVQKAVEQEERMATLVNEELRESEQEGPLLQEKIPNEPSERIEAYMDRLENVFLNKDERVRGRNLEMLHDKIYDALIIKKENFPESYFELQKRIVRERGMGDVEITPEMREQMMDTAIEDQKHSLDAWIDYLTEEDVAYPTWFKYYVWNQITKLSQFDKELGKFKKRTDSTVAPFPDIHRGALAQILDVYEKVREDNKNLKDPEIQEAFSKKFPTFYAELISKSLAEKIENKENIQGEWVKYNKGDSAEADKLFESMQGKGTGWCVEGKETSHKYIKTGDFYVYYTNDAQDNPIQPRLAIQMTGGNQIGQIRGILPHQEVEPIMQEVLDKKLGEFGKEADSYRKKSEDMKRVTALERKQEKDEEFTIEDLLFIYQVNSQIENFGYNDEDPRINEIIERRNVRDDTSNLSRYIIQNKDNFSEEVYKNATDTARLEEIFNNPSISNEDLIFAYQIKSHVGSLAVFNDNRLADFLKSRDSGNDYMVISRHILNNPEQFSDSDKEKALDTLKFEEIVHKYGELTKEEIEFLYEVNSKVKLFGAEIDKLDKFKSQRDPVKNVAVLLGYELTEVASNQEQVNDNTKVYFGPLFKGIFRKNIEHIYHPLKKGELIPTREIEVEKFMNVEIGGKSKEEIYSALQEHKVDMPYNNATLIIESPGFITSVNVENVNVLIIAVKDFGFPRYPSSIQGSPLGTGPTFGELFKKAEELGLKLLPVDAAPYLKLNIKSSKNVCIATQPATTFDPLMKKYGKSFFHMSEGAHRRSGGTSSLYIQSFDSIEDYRTSDNDYFLFQID